MPDDALQFLARADGVRLAYRHRPGDPARPGVVSLHGFRSDMTGQKGEHIAAWCAAHGVGCTRLDYSGHGTSGGAFANGSIGAWTADALAVIDAVTAGPLVLVGSSMGGWIMLLAAKARPQRVAGLVGLAAAPDFTEDLLWAAMREDQRAAMVRDGRIEAPSAYSDAPDVYTLGLVEDGRANLVLRDAIPFRGPVRLLHGQRDPDVPWQTALRTAEALAGDDVRITLVKDGDHRLSRAEDLALLSATLDEITETVARMQRSEIRDRR
ncbi:MAG: alpha/beta hydrolase [Alphaproteobacteria bacterium]